MIIDSYCHIGRNIYDNMQLNAQQLIKQMDSYKIDLSFVSPFSPADCDFYKANMTLYQDTRRFKQRLRCVCRLDPKTPEHSYLLAARLKKLGFKAVELDPFEQAFRLNDIFLFSFLTLIHKLSMPVIIRSGFPGLSEPAMVSSLASAFPSIKIMMTHGGQLAMHGLAIQDAVDAVASNDNLFLEISGIPETGRENLVEKLVGLGLEDRIVFGSNTPIFDIDVELTRLKVFAGHSDLFEKFSFKNACKLFNGKDKSMGSICSREDDNTIPKRKGNDR